MTRKRSWLSIGAAAVALALAAVPATATARTIKLKASVVWDPDNYSSAGQPKCAEKWILLVVVPRDVKSYTARTTEHGESFGNPCTMVFSEAGPPFTNPITGFGSPYKVRKGDAGWFLGGDSGPGFCSNPPGKYRAIRARGVVK